MSKDWMLTTTGRQVWPLALKAEDVNLTDIASSLGKQCRYNGHVSKFYSVAEHSVLISRALQRDGYGYKTQFAGLHHDDYECYSGDIIRPMKNSILAAGVDLKQFEIEGEKAISAAFGIRFPWPEVIKFYDAAIIADEKRQLKKGGPSWEAFGVPDDAAGLGVEIKGWEWKRATFEFIERHDELMASIRGSYDGN